MNKLFKRITIITAAAAISAAAADAFERRGLIVPYAEDHFPDMASMRYDRSPYYRAIERAVDTAAIAIPADWEGKRIVVGVGYPSDTFHLPDLRINGIDPGPGIRQLRWDATKIAKAGETLRLEGLGNRPRRVYAYATPREVWVDDYRISSSLDSADITTGIFDVDIDLGGINRIRRDIAVEYMLFDAGRHQVAAGRTDAAPNIRFRARIPNIRRWSTDDPYRYMIAIILRDDRTGRHIMTVGSPMRFANYTVSAAEGPTLNGVAMAPLALAALDSIPASPDDREALAAALRAAGANAVIAPPGVDPDTDWRNFCADRGILCYADGALDPMTLFAADPEEAERPQLHGGFERMAARYARVHTELLDTSTLTIAATTRSPFAPLSDFSLDYEFVTPLGRTLTSGEGIVVVGDAREVTPITLVPPLPGHVPGKLDILPDDVPEAFLNVAWRPLRRMAGAEPGVETGREQFVIGHYPGLPDTKFRKLKNRKNGRWTAGKSEILLDPATGLPRSLRIDGTDIVRGAMGLTIDGMTARPVATDISYDGRERCVVARIDIDNPSTSLPVGNAVIAYYITDDNLIDIAILEATQGVALTFPNIGQTVYLGRGPGDSPSSDYGRIALYSARAKGRGATPDAHADTRSFSLPAYGMTATLHRPATLTVAPALTAISASASRLRLSPSN